MGAGVGVGLAVLLSVGLAVLLSVGLAVLLGVGDGLAAALPGGAGEGLLGAGAGGAAGEAGGVAEAAGVAGAVAGWLVAETGYRQWPGGRCRCRDHYSGDDRHNAADGASRQQQDDPGAGWIGPRARAR